MSSNNSTAGDTTVSALTNDTRNTSRAGDAAEAADADETVDAGTAAEAPLDPAARVSREQPRT